MLQEEKDLIDFFSPISRRRKMLLGQDQMDHPLQFRVGMVQIDP